MAKLMMIALMGILMAAPVLAADEKECTKPLTTGGIQSNPKTKREKASVSKDAKKKDSTATGADE